MQPKGCKKKLSLPPQNWLFLIQFLNYIHVTPIRILSDFQIIL